MVSNVFVCCWSLLLGREVEIIPREIGKSCAGDEVKGKNWGDYQIMRSTKIEAKWLKRKLVVIKGNVSFTMSSGFQM